MKDFEQQFRDAFERYSDELFRHASMRLSDRERAVELTQDAFMRTWDYARKGGEVRELRPFLYQTLRHLIIDEYRKAKTNSLDSMLENSESGAMEAMLPTDDTNTMEAAMERLADEGLVSRRRGAGTIVNEPGAWRASDVSSSSTAFPCTATSSRSSRAWAIWTGFKSRSGFIFSCP